MEPVYQTKTPSKTHQTPRKTANVAPTRPAANDASLSTDEEIVPNPHLFDVYLRIRPVSRKSHENPRFLSTIPTQPTNVYVTPPPPARTPLNQKGSSNQLTTDRGIKDGATSPRPNPREAAKAKSIEKFSFNEIFPENTSQRDVFESTTLPLLIETIGARNSVTGPRAERGQDCLLATLGLTGTGKTHTILGSRAQWGMLQMTLKVLFDAVGNTFYPYSTITQHLRAGDDSHATIADIDGFLENMSPAMNTHLQKATEEARLAQEPDIKDIIRAVKGCIDTHCAYAVMVSMYEVYNERVYDLLDPSSWEHHQQELQRQAAAAAAAAARTPSRNRSLSRPQTPAPRPKTPQTQPTPQPLARRKNLPYRKVISSQGREKRAVLGLKKIYVRNMEEAILLIEHAQTCRHTSSGGGNSKGSRGHAFFNIDIVRMYSVHEGGRSGVKIRTNTLSIVDLAGSERQKKTQTKSEKAIDMGSINKNLMSLGQCLQMQGRTENGKPIVPPYREDKLTEIMLSNAFRAVAPQKGIMIVTADPQGDFNSTLQILKYSALASETTAPRAASNRVVSTSGTVISLNHNARGAANPGTAPPDDTVDPPPIVVDHELIKRLVDRLEETEILFRRAEDARKNAEKQCTEALQRLVLAKQRALEAEEQTLQIEIQVREELTEEFEKRERVLHGAYMKRIKDEEEAGREFVDNKLELAMRKLELDGMSENDEEAWERVEELEVENEALKIEVRRLEELLASGVGMGSPSPAGGKRGGGVVPKRINSDQTRKKVAFDP